MYDTLQTNYSEYLRSDSNQPKNRFHLEIIKCYMYMYTYSWPLLSTILFIQSISSKTFNTTWAVQWNIFGWVCVALYSIVVPRIIIELFRFWLFFFLWSIVYCYWKIWCHLMKGIQLYHCVIYRSTIDKHFIIEMICSFQRFNGYIVDVELLEHERLGAYYRSLCK